MATGRGSSHYPYADVVKDDHGNHTTEDGSDDVHVARCSLHRDKFVDQYCSFHDEICCSDCVLVNHSYRKCNTLSTVKASKGFRSNDALKKNKETSKMNMYRCLVLKKKHQKFLKKKQEAIEKVDKYEKEIIAKIRELAEKSRDEIRSGYAGIDKNGAALDIIKATNARYVERLDNTEDEEELFLYVKRNKTVSDDGQTRLEAIAEDAYKRFQYNINPRLEECIRDMTSLGLSRRLGFEVRIRGLKRLGRSRNYDEEGVLRELDA